MLSYSSMCSKSLAVGQDFIGRELVEELCSVIKNSGLEALT